jgi:hypothetical protein
MNDIYEITNIKGNIKGKPISVTNGKHTINTTKKTISMSKN